MKPFFPATGAEADWNAAYYRLEDYLRALRVINKVHQSQAILGILERAAARHAQDPTQNPTELAMQEARDAMNRWFEGILGRRERIAVVGLISILAVDAPDHWPAAFLSDDLPAELRVALRESDVRAGPDLEVSSMVPRAIDVSPLLDPIDLPGTLEKAWRGLAFLAAAVLLGVISFSLFLFMR